MGSSLVLQLLESLGGDKSAERSRRPRGKYRRFLKGPVDWDWLLSAAELPGQALFVGLALQRLAGVERTRTVDFSLRGFRRHSGSPLGRNTLRRGLEALEKANLIVVERSGKRALKITLLDCPPIGNSEPAR